GDYTAITAANHEPSPSTRIGPPNSEVGLAISVKVRNLGSARNVCDIRRKVIAEVGIADAKNTDSICHRGWGIRRHIYGQRDWRITACWSQHASRAGTIHFGLRSRQNRAGPT